MTQQDIDYSDRCHNVASKLGLKVIGLTPGSGFTASEFIENKMFNPIRISDFLMEKIEKLINDSSPHQSS